MTNILSYKGYSTRIYFDADDKILYGKIEYISDLVNFHATTTKEIVEEFHKAVDDYLDYCSSLGIKPNKPLKSEVINNEVG